MFHSNGVHGAHAIVSDEACVAPPWSSQQAAALTEAFLSECEAVARSATPKAKLSIIRRVMRHHIDAGWSEAQILELEGLMQHYRRRLLDRELGSFDRAEILKRIYTDIEPEWMEAEIIRLHFILLDSCASLADPQCPLEEKLDILQWILADDTQACAPFSFYRCARSAWGSCDVSGFREDLRALLPSWVAQSIAQCPVEVQGWVGQELKRDPGWLSERLQVNPQFLNETAKALRRQPDLFGVSA